MTRREIRDLYVNTVDSIRSGAISTPEERRLARTLVNQHIASQDGARHVATVSAPFPEQLTLSGILAARGMVA